MNSSEGIEAMLAELSVLYDSKSSSRDSETLGVDENSHKVRTPRDNAVINADALRVSRESDDPRVTPDLVQCFIDENNLVNQLCEVRAPATLFLEPPKGKRNKSYKRLLFDRFVMFDPPAELLKSR